MRRHLVHATDSRSRPECFDLADIAHDLPDSDRCIRWISVEPVRTGDQDAAVSINVAPGEPPLRFAETRIAVTSVRPPHRDVPRLLRPAPVTEREVRSTLRLSKARCGVE